MFAYRRGSQFLAGAAPLEHRVPAATGSCIQSGYSSVEEQQPGKLSVAGSTPAIRTLSANNE